MSREDIQKLLGGYATGTLTEEEQQILFAAALDDQELFNALAREQSLRDLLRDPPARAQVMAALEKPRAGWLGWWWRPALAAAAMAVVATVAIFVVRQNQRPAQLAPLAVNKPLAPALPEAQPPQPQDSALRDQLRTERREPAARSAAPKTADLKKIAPPIDAMAPPAPPPASAAAPAAPGGSAQSVIVTGSESAALEKFKSEKSTLSDAESLRAKTIGSLKNPAEADAISLFYGSTPSQQQFSTNFLATDGRDTNAGFSGSAGQQQTAPQTPQQGFGPKQQTAGERQQSARAAAAVGGMAGAAKTPQLHLGMSYRVLRRLPTGEFVDVEPGADLDRGALIKLQILPNDSGNLLILESAPDGEWKEVTSTRVERMALFETATFTTDRSGPMQFRATLSRESLTANLAAAPAAAKALTMTAVTKSGAGPLNWARATYAVNPVVGAREVAFTISLNYK